VAKGEGQKIYQCVNTAHHSKGKEAFELLKEEFNHWFFTQPTTLARIYNYL
jgi:hypothetical protein